MKNKSYLKIKEVAGSSKDPGHVGEIEISSFSFSNPETHLPDSKIYFFTFDRMASTIFFQRFAEGNGFPEAILTSESEMNNGRRILSLKIKMKRVFVNFYRAEATFKKKEIAVNVGLNFDSIRYEYGAVLPNQIKRAN